MKNVRIGLVLLAALLEAGFLAILSLRDLDANAPEFILAYLLTSLFYLVGCYLATQPRTFSPSEIRFIWFAAVAFRVTLLPLEPTLSEDLTRYRWQGKLQAAGGNPYLEVPEDPKWEGLQDSTWAKVTRKDLPSVYGPLYELFNAAWYRLASWATEDELLQVWSFKLPFAALELAAGWALAALIRALSLPAGRLLIYLWSPLIVVEFWAQGHNDSATVLLVVLALTAASLNKWKRAFSWLTLAAMAKFWPAILFPFFGLQRVDGKWHLRWKAALVVAPLVVLLCLPYAAGISNVTEMLEGFVGGWRNNDSLYGWIYEHVDEDFDRGTELVTEILMYCIFAVWALQLPLERSAKWCVVALLFLSANCFPWYLSWLVPLLALRPNAALLMWTALVALSYHILIRYSILGVWQDVEDIRMIEYIPVYALLIGTMVVDAIRRFGRIARGD